MKSSKFLILLTLFAPIVFAESLETPPIIVFPDENSSTSQSSPSEPRNDKHVIVYRKDRRPSGEANIAAIVNGTPISVKDVKNKLKLALKMPLDKLSPMEKEQVQRQILSTLIDESIKIQTTEKLGLKIDPKDIESTMEHIEKQNGMPKGGLRKMLKDKGVAESVFTNGIKADILWRQYIGAWAGNTLELNKKELQELVTPSLSETIQYHLAEIEIYTPEGEPEEKSLDALNKILEKLKSKQPFMMLAHTLSHAPSAARGGDIGWINQDMLDTETLEVIEKLRPGQVTSPLKTDHGYKIILLIDKKDMGTLQPTLTARQIEIKISEDISSKPKDLNEKMEKLTKLVQTITTCSEFDQLADQIPDSQIHVYKTVRLSELSPDLQMVLKDLEIGIPSKAIFNSSNNTIVFFLLCEKNETLVDKAKSVEGIANEISNQRFMSISEQKLKEAKRVASIEIRI